MAGAVGGSVATYRGVLGLPGLAPLYVIGFAARLPVTATGVVLTLHVAIGLDRGFAAAGLVGGAITAGIALFAPFVGRLVDRFGLRRVLVLCGLAQAVFWGLVPLLDATTLIPTAFGAGLLAPPAFAVVRQSLAASVPAEHQRPAFALDAMSTEVAYAVGPALGTLVVLTLPGTGPWLVGAAFVLATVALGWLDPPVRRGGARPGERPPPVRTWLRGAMLVALGSTAAAILMLTATELSVVAMLTARDETAWFALANTVWCAASLVGGWIYGAARRPPPTAVLLGLLALGSLPVALGGPWWMLTLLLVPAGAFCAPALAAAAETVGRLAPDDARGVATGLHGSALMVGATLASPLAGVLIDRVAPAAAIGVAAGITLLVAVVAALVTGTRTGSRAR
ncbi:putative MFS family arabinose efflux permease [Actinomycetospora succinea]|uniref:Putative MFS family arabinose efflux permease n=1 Tax=Actinomycetospora succinea TaxID=663603 RepID=A0A4R6UV57_9PSEU|nr:MFS transporter [Actinomycetospora succinea]TDQ50146.1 putative MFS family arabinose efflux permease [Actinomycetospora succinea]